MTDRRLYTISIPDNAQTRGEGRQQRNISDLAAVAGGSSSTTPLGLSAGQRRLRVQYKGYNDSLLGQSLAELAESEDLETLPYYGVNPDGTRDRTEKDGYYTVKRAENSNPDDRSETFPTVNLNITKVGTQNSHWRILTAKPTQVENQFGNDTTEELGVPASAQKVQWYDRDITTTGASPVSSVTTQHGTVDIYDAADSPYSRIALLYEIPYVDEGKVDPSVLDTRNEPSKTADVDGNTVVEWSKVSHPAHEFIGDMVISNDRIRLTIDEANQSLSAEEYTSGSWSSVTLGTSDWTILDVDLQTIDYSRVTAVCVFINTATSETYRLDLQLDRGATGFIFYIPENLYSSQGDVPQGLKDLLSPIASSRIVTMNQNQTVKKRTEVRG